MNYEWQKVSIKRSQFSIKNDIVNDKGHDFVFWMTLWQSRMHSSRMCTTRSLTVCHACPPLPCMPPNQACPTCHACPLPYTPPAMHAPQPSMPHLPCMPPPAMHAPHHTCPPAMHASLPHMPPCYTCPLPCMSPPPVDRILDICFWKYFLAPTSLRAVKMWTAKRVTILWTTALLISQTAYLY